MCVFPTALAHKQCIFHLQVDLTPLQLVEVSKRLGDRQKIKEVGLHLGLKDFVINGILGDKTPSTEAAGAMLDKWRDGVSSPQEAKAALIKALEDCGQHKIVFEVFGSSVSGQ